MSVASVQTTSMRAVRMLKVIEPRQTVSQIPGPRGVPDSQETSATSAIASAPPPPKAASRQAVAPVTMRGRIALAGLVVLLVTAVPMIAAVVAQATSHALPPRVAERNLVRVTVRPGQSLWTVAADADPDVDPRVVTQEIIQLNALAGTVIYPGELLWVPTG
jgi:LysM repeat protein